MDVLCCGGVHASRVTLQYHLSMECRGAPRVHRPVQEVCRGRLLVARGNAEPQVARAYITGPGCLHQEKKGTGDPIARLASDGPTGPLPLSTAAAPSAPVAVTIVGPTADGPGTSSFITDTSCSCRGAEGVR